MKRALVLSWIFIFIVSIVSFAQEISEEAKRHYERGITALEMIENTQFANYTDAIKEFNKVKELAPQFKDVYLKLGQIYLKLKKYQEAAKNYKEYLPLETDAKKVSEIKTLINKLEYKAEKAREIEPPTYNDVRVGDWVKIKHLATCYGVFSGTLKTITCIDKDNFFVKLRTYEFQFDSEWEDDRYEIHSITEPVHLPILEFLKNAEETIIDSGKKSGYYWVKTKANRQNTEFITEWRFSKAVPLAYLYYRNIRYKYRNDDNCSIEDYLTDWGRGQDKANVSYKLKTKGSLNLYKHTFRPRQKIQVHFTAEKGFTSSAWIGIIPSHVYHGSEILNDSYKIAQKYLKNRATGTLTFKAPRQPGSYDLRLHNSDTTGKEVTYVTFQVE